MEQVDEHLQSAPHDRVRTSTINVDDETDAAGVVLVTRVVQALGFGRGPGSVLARVVGDGVSEGGAQRRMGHGPNMAYPFSEVKYKQPIEHITFRYVSKPVEMY